MRLGAMILPGLIWVLSASALAGEPTVGSWEVVCHDTCTMRHRDASVRVGGLTADLEVQSVGGALVPVVVARGLPAQAAVVAASVSVGLRLDKGPWAEMACTGLLICAPSEADAPGLGQAFPGARSVSLRVQVTVPGAPALPPVEHAFGTAGTREALARLKAGGAVTTSAPGLDWMGLARKLMKGAGG
jgi:hypothetical protein